MKTYPLLVILVFSLIACTPKQSIQNSSDSAEKAEAAYQIGKTAETQRKYAKAWQSLTLATELAPNNSLYLNDTGVLANFLGRYNKAIELLNKALDIDLKILGPDHPIVATSWSNLGHAWTNKREYEKAIDYHEKSLASNLKTYGPDHPTVAINWNNLGGAWKEKRKYDQAREYFEKALALFKKIGMEKYAQLVEENIRSLPPEK